MSRGKKIKIDATETWQSSGRWQQKIDVATQALKKACGDTESVAKVRLLKYL